jgi:hypothetical protein
LYFHDHRKPSQGRSETPWQKHCAKKAGVSLETLVHMEGGLKALSRTKEAIQSALEAAGIEFMSGAQVRLTERE